MSGGVLKYEIVTAALWEELLAAINERRYATFRAVLADTPIPTEVENFSVRIETLHVGPPMYFDVMDPKRGWWFRLGPFDRTPVQFEVVIS